MSPRVKRYLIAFALIAAGFGWAIACFYWQGMSPLASFEAELGYFTLVMAGSFTPWNETYLGAFTGAFIAILKAI